MCVVFVVCFTVNLSQYGCMMYSAESVVRRVAVDSLSLLHALYMEERAYQCHHLVLRDDGQTKTNSIVLLKSV